MRLPPWRAPSKNMHAERDEKRGVSAIIINPSRSPRTERARTFAHLAALCVLRRRRTCHAAKQAKSRQVERGFSHGERAASASAPE